MAYSQSISSACNNVWSTGGIQSILFCTKEEFMNFRAALSHPEDEYILGPVEYSISC